MDFYDCEPVLQPDYESPNEDAMDQEKQAHRRLTVSAVMLFRKCRTPSLKKIITESSTDSPRAKFAKLKQKFYKNTPIQYPLFTWS